MSDFHHVAPDIGSSLYKIIYRSDIQIEGGHDRVTAHIKQILEWSRAWNPRHGISGALMLNDDKFAQVIEGPVHAVKSLFGHIVCDRRHKNVQLLLSDRVRERDFGSWSMAYTGRDYEPDIPLATGPRLQREGFGADARGVLDMLRWLLSERQVKQRIR